MGVKYVNGQAIYTVDKGTNLDHKAKIDISKIQNSEKKTKALTKEYSKARKKYKKKKKKEAKQKASKESAIKNKTGITGGVAQKAMDYRKEHPYKSKPTAAKKARAHAKAIPNQKLTSNEQLLLQTLSRTGTPDVVNKGLKSAEKTLRTPKAKTNEYKNLNKRVAKQDEKFLNSSPFAYGVMAGTSPIPLKQTLEKQTGRKIDTSKAEKTVGYKAGYMAGLAGEYALTGGIARGAVEQSVKTALKQAGKKAGKEAVKDIAKEAGKKNLAKVGKKMLTGAAADTITGVPTNALEAGKEAAKAPRGEKGKTFAKSMALNTAFDVGLGAGGEGAAALVKSIKKRTAEKAAAKAAETVTQTKRAKAPRVQPLQERLAAIREARKEVPQAPANASSIVKKAEQRKVQQVAAAKSGNIDRAWDEINEAKNYIDSAKAEYNRLREERINSLEDYIKNYEKKGSKRDYVPANNEYGQEYYIPQNYSLNDKWYSDYYKANAKAPAKKDARAIAEKLVDEGAAYKDSEFFDADLSNLKQTIDSEETIYRSLAHSNDLSDSQLAELAERFTDKELGKRVIDRSALEKDLGADINRNKPKYKESTAAVNEVRPEGKKVMYETETHALREQAAKDRLATDYDAEYKDLMSKDEYTSEDLATMGELLKREKNNFSRFHKLTQKAGEVSSRKGQELEAVKHIKENTAAGKAIKAEQASRKSVKQMEKANPLKLKQTDTQAKETIEEIGKAVDTAVDKTIKNVLSQYKEASGKQIANRLAGTSKKANRAELQKSFDIMVKDVTDLVGKLEQKQTVKNEIEKFAKSVFERNANRQDFTQVFDYVEDTLRKSGTYTEAVEARLKGIKETFEKDYSSARLGKAIDEALENAQLDIKQLMKQSKTAKTDAKNVVVDTITKKLREAGVDDKSVKVIADDINKTFDAKLDEAARAYLTQKFTPKKASKKEKNTMIENVMELIHMGAYDDADIVNLMRAKNGVNVLTPQQTKQIVDYMDIYEANPNTREGKEALAKANKIIANLEGSDFGDKFRSVQRVAMLFNPKTWLSRNAGGNLLLMGAENIKDIPASVIDTLVSLKTGERTTAGITRAKLKAQGKGLKEGFKEQLLDIRHGVDTAHARTKYEMPNKDVWKNKPMKFLDNLIGQLLQLGDRPFYEAAYKARKAELENFVKKGKSKLTAEEIEAEAKYFALDRVFQADTSIAEAANHIRKGLNKMGGGIVGNIVLPFTQTPSNIIAKLLDYSPAGLLKAVKELSKTRKGTFNQKVFVDTLGRTFTGAGVITLGYVLANKKLMTVDLYAQSGKDQQTQKAYEKQGLQSYAIQLDDGTSFTIDWANPIGSLLILGAEGYYGGANQEDFITALFGGGEAAVDSVFNQSFLQGLQTLFSSKDGSIAEGIGKTMLSATTQPLPSVIQQLTRIVDPSKRETYDENIFQRQLNVLMSKTPYLSTKLPEKKDVTGQTVEQFQGRSIARKILEAYLNPANISQRQYNSVNDEAVRVYEATGEKGALLRVTDDKDFKYDGATYKLKNAAEVSRFQEVQGKYAYDELSKLMNSSEYRGKSDSEKAEMIRKVTLKAREKAEEDYLIKNEGYTQTQLDFNKLSESKREDYKSTDMTKRAYIEAINTAKTYNADGKGPLKKDEFQKYVRENGVSSSVARQLWTVYGFSPRTNPY